ncbi:hypothetical protein A5482_009795 [Cyanobacterium sp. IPPAS B-1200]|uniref:hypothetical protein n=1 Tax=Cyanobacterium sp. IPPAS B-1200 TaxID=1562720 RepID=UPI0008526786|nr:hypothetical protein [Cyanobacterium sp. IPPAS B-1200]OEJ80150.1 hypothetical protein A5482_06710 [Cyanobacterium sp. IPPAS B-1200]
MTTLLEKAFQQAQRLSSNIQDEIAQQLMFDIDNELKWQESLSNSHTNSDALVEMAKMAIIEDKEGKTEDKGFGED